MFASASEWVKNRRAGPDVFPVSVSVFASASEWAKNIETEHVSSGLTRKRELPFLFDRGSADKLLLFLGKQSLPFKM